MPFDNKIVCSGNGCDKSFIDSRYGLELAKKQGWIHLIPGQSRKNWRCPKHIPQWADRLKQ